MYQKWCPLSNPILLISDKAANYWLMHALYLSEEKRKMNWPKSLKFFRQMGSQNETTSGTGLDSGWLFCWGILLPAIDVQWISSSKPNDKTSAGKSWTIERTQWRYFYQQFHNILNRKNTPMLHQIVFGTGHMDLVAIELWRYHRTHESSRGQRRSIRNSSARRAFWREPKIVVLTSIPCLF